VNDDERTSREPRASRKMRLAPGRFTLDEGGFPFVELGLSTYIQGRRDSLF